MARREFNIGINKFLLDAFKKAIINLKKELKLKQKTMAEKSCLDKRYIQNLLANKETHNPSLDTLYKLAIAFDLSLPDFVAKIMLNYTDEAVAS